MDGARAARREMPSPGRWDTVVTSLVRRAMCGADGAGGNCRPTSGRRYAAGTGAHRGAWRWMRRPGGEGVARAMEAPAAAVQGRRLEGDRRVTGGGGPPPGMIERRERRRAGGRRARPRPRPVYEAAKRVVDVVGALALTAVASPLFPVAAVAVRLSSPGPVIYRQTRIGRRGRPFTCLMFRTMVVDGDHLLEGRAPVDSQGGAWKPNPDPRVTPMGRWLRRRSIDELPQVVNVLRGEMSLVGPRPLQPEEVEERWGDRRA